MAVQKDLAVAYHQQDTDYYCGAACAQMVLDSIGAGLLDQDDLYADNHAYSTLEAGWYTAPDGLQWTLNDRRPAGFGGWFALYALAVKMPSREKLSGPSTTIRWPPLHSSSVGRTGSWCEDTMPVRPREIQPTHPMRSRLLTSITHGHRHRAFMRLRRRTAPAMVAARVAIMELQMSTSPMPPGKPIT